MKLSEKEFEKELDNNYVNAKDGLFAGKLVYFVVADSKVFYKIINVGKIRTVLEKIDADGTEDYQFELIGKKGSVSTEQLNRIVSYQDKLRRLFR